MKITKHSRVNGWNDWIWPPNFALHLYNMHKEKTVVCILRPWYNGEQGDDTMKDIPVFDTEFGVASLFVRQIPYRQQAHIKIQVALDAEKLLEECVGFCRMCGAEHIYAAGDAYLEKYPRYATLVEMRCDRASIGESDACLFPVTEATVAQWLQIYNARMADVPNAAYMDNAQGRELIKNGGGYFVHRDGKLLGIGKISEDLLDAVISVEPGMGETVVKALVEVMPTDTVRLLVAKENQRAMGLYTRLGFLEVQEVSNWYKIC